MPQPQLISSYEIEADNVPAVVKIWKLPDEFVPIYEVIFPQVNPATNAVLDSIREQLAQTIKVEKSGGKKKDDETGAETEAELEEKFRQKVADAANQKIKKSIPNVSEHDLPILVGILLHDMIGLGPLEVPLVDEMLEEIVINGSKDPIWCYHKRHGWLKSSIKLPNEETIYNYCARIGRKVGRRITTLDPLMDAHLPSGERINATLFPISSTGHTMTIRKFSKVPWTVTHMLESNTCTAELMATLWQGIQYEMNVLISGGTASGKTSYLGSTLSFMPPNHRILTIEDTRELQLPEQLHWVPLRTRPKNPEGLGEVSMLDLVVNSLRMRPDRIIVGEIRASETANTLLEAAHTGHSVYGTVHANTNIETYRRMVNKPINVPKVMFGAIDLINTQYRHRRLGIRRTLELGEVIVETRESEDEVNIRVNILYRWNPRKDRQIQVNPSIRMKESLELYSGMTEKEIKEDIQNKMKVLNWLRENPSGYGVKSVDAVGQVINSYYLDEADLLEKIEKNIHPKKILTEEQMQSVIKINKGKSIIVKKRVGDAASKDSS